MLSYTELGAVSDQKFLYRDHESEDKPQRYMKGWGSGEPRYQRRLSLTSLSTRGLRASTRIFESPNLQEALEFILTITVSLLRLILGLAIRIRTILFARYICTLGIYHKIGHNVIHSVQFPTHNTNTIVISKYFTLSRNWKIEL